MFPFEFCKIFENTIFIEHLFGLKTQSIAKRKHQAFHLTEGLQNHARYVLISILVLDEFERINEPLFLLKSSQNHR